MATPTQYFQAAPTPLHDLIAGHLYLGHPDVTGALAVFPIIGPAPRFEYTSFADGRNHGAHITELEGGASVRDLLINNPTPRPLLLFEGEEVLGAQQNRTLDVTVLAAAGAKTRIPVSCVEQGRWDGLRHNETFDRAPQAAYPELRRAKARQVRASVRAGVEARADQSTVWDEVAIKAARHGVHSSTGAMHDVFEGRRDRLNAMQVAIRLHEGQLGALVAISGRIAVLDYVSRPAVFADLHGPLVQGYALDAIEHQPADVPAEGEAGGFLSLALENRPVLNPGVGLGEDLRFEGNGSEGAGLAIEDELLALTAFPSEGSSPAGRASARQARIRRPSRRRT